MIGDPLVGPGDDEQPPVATPDEQVAADAADRRRDATGSDPPADGTGSGAAGSGTPVTGADDAVADVPRWRHSGGDTAAGGRPAGPAASDEPGRSATGPAGDEQRGGDRARPGVAFTGHTDQVPARTRQVPAPVLPPGGLATGPPAPASDAADPLWAATVSGAPLPGSAVPAGAASAEPFAARDDAEGELARLARIESRPNPAIAPPRPETHAPAGELAATAAMPTAGQARPGDLTATTAMPAVAPGGVHDTMAMPAVTAAAPGAEHAAESATAQRRHRRRWWRRSFKALLAVVFLGLVYVGVNFALVLRTAHTDQARPVDVIVVLGAAQYDGRPSPLLQARLDHTIDLWDADLAAAVFVTGGKQPGDRFTEAEASRNYLVDRGVPADVIQMEDTAHSTWESFANLASVAGANDWQRVLIVTDPFHSLRSRLIAQELGFTAYTSPTQTSPVQGGEELMKELKEALGISLGRIIGFERLWKLTG